MIGVKKDWLGENYNLAVKIEEGLIKTEVGGKDNITIWSVYNSGNLKKFRGIWENVDFLEENKIVIGGDFNVRIGELGGVKVGKDEIWERKLN